MLAVALIIFTSCQRQISEADLRRDFRAEDPHSTIVSISDVKGNAVRSKVQIQYTVFGKNVVYSDTWYLEPEGGIGGLYQKSAIPDADHSAGSY